MNFMRKMVGQNRPIGSGAPDPAQSAQDNALGLMHLKKLFNLFKHPEAGSTQQVLEDKLYNMLPLFCTIFGQTASCAMTEKFGDVLQFCSHVSRLMVSEIRRRASNQSTDAASSSIVKFLEIESTEESSNGWMLLTTLNMLSSGDESLVDCMTAASLPSTMVKCLYLFFDLPEVVEGTVLPGSPACEFTSEERRVLLQKVFVQLLVRLCSHVSPAEELARKDDLNLLFSAITSWCPKSNVAWRKSAGEVLMTLSRHGLTPNVVEYIHSKRCIALCIENMQRVQELSPLELVEMLVTVFCLLKDSGEVSQTLLDDFRSCHGYVFLSDFVLKLENSHTEECIQALRNLVLLVGSMTSCGYIELKPSSASSGSLFQMPNFTVPQPTGKGVSVRNIQAFQVLQTIFLKSSSVQLCVTILDVISSIYHQDNANYFILEPQCTLSQFIERIHLKSPDIQNKLFEILEFLVFHLNFVPCKELISLSILVKTNSSLECSILCMKSLLRILRYHSMYKDVFREVGLLEVMVTSLQRYAALLKEPQNEEEVELVGGPEQEMGNLTMDGLTQLLNSNSQNANVFRECGGARCSHNMVPYPQCRQQALNIVQQLMLSTGGDDDMGTLLGLMHTAKITALELKTHILKSLLTVLRESHRTRTVFRKVGGFVYVMSVLVSMEGCFAEPPKTPWDTAKRNSVITLLKTVFSTLTIAMRYEPANAKFFATEVRYSSLTEAVRLLGCFSSQLYIEPVPPHVSPSEEEDFPEFFVNLKENNIKSNVPPTLVSACLMIRYLYDMALDNFDRPTLLPNVSSSVQSDGISPHLKRISSVMESSTNSGAASSHQIALTNNGDMSPSKVERTGPIPPNSLPHLVKRNSTDDDNVDSWEGSLSAHLMLPTQEPSIVHAGAVVSILHLVPAIEFTTNSQMALDLQAHTCDVLKSLVRTERNQQVMCEAGLPHELLTYCTVTLANEKHPLHVPVQYMFERLAAQCLTPKDLRDFLRLGYPLCCAKEDDIDHNNSTNTTNSNVSTPSYVTAKPLTPPIETKSLTDVSVKGHSNGGSVPLTRVKCLVSMTTPRDVRLHGASITPAFVEFDMCAEGFGCLYLPSVSPQGPPTPSVVGAGMIGGSDPGVVGGIGSGERLFPPQAGMTFSSWICVDKFSLLSVDPHPVRLLTLVRHIQGRDDHLICLHVQLAARDRALFVSSKELNMPQPGAADFDLNPVLSETTVRFWCPEMTQDGQWRHIVLIFHKAGIMKNSSVSLFIDGCHVSTQKLHYISPNLGSTGTASATSATSVYAYIGTPPPIRRQSRLIWRQGPCHLFEDIISTNAVQAIYQLGPNYVGSFQAPISESNDTTAPIIAEEKIMFGVHAHAMSLMTVAKIRKVYNRVDGKSIAKQLGMSAHENATPIRILHNSAGHLNGAARSFGAILMGYLGVRTFCPKPVAKIILNIGGTSALLGLIAMASDVESLYAAVKALVCVVRSNKGAQMEMDRIKGYQMLALLYKKKKNLLNSHILHLTFSLVGTVDSGRESTVIPNKTAFADLLCDLEVWHEAPSDLHRSLYEHFYELLTESTEQKTNLRLMHELGLVSRLLIITRDKNLSVTATDAIINVLSVLLASCSYTPSLLKFGQYLASTLPNCSEKNIQLNTSNADLNAKPNDDTSEASSYTIQHRNSLLEILLKLLTMPPTSGGVNLIVCEELQRVLGFDWLLLMMQSHIHASTVVLSMRVLLVMLRSPVAMNKFREGSSAGGWLADTHSVLNNRKGVLLGMNNSRMSIPAAREINQEICHLPGFIVLQWLIPKHSHIPKIYLLLIALLLGQPVKQLPQHLQFDLDSVWTFIFGVPPSQPLPPKTKMDLCPEAAVVILAMVRAMLSQNSEPSNIEPVWLQDYPVTLMQFLLFLYHNQPDFVPLCMTAEFLCALAATLFPSKLSENDTDSEMCSPVEDFKPFPGSESMVLITTTEKQGNSSCLTSHPARKFVMDFLRMIVVDSLSLPHPSKTAPVIDLLLEASPENATQSQRREFQTEMLKSLMDHLLAADALLGDQAALPLASGGSYTHMATNVFYFAGRLVDKLWQGIYVRETKEVFEFVSTLISQAKRKSSGLSLDVIYRCLNRTILYQLSRPLQSVADQTLLLNALHQMTSNRSLVFGPGNYDQEFIACLCYCLLQMTVADTNTSTAISNIHNRRTTWHVDVPVSFDGNSQSEMPGYGAEDSLSKSMYDTANSEVFNLISTAAKRVWDDLYVAKKPAIEEIFKVTLNTTELGANMARYSTPDLANVKPLPISDARPVIFESACRLWHTYYENEGKCVYSNTERIHNQLHSRLQKMGHGVLRLATRKPKEKTPVKASTFSVQDICMWTATHLCIVKDLVEYQYKQHQQCDHHMRRFLLEEWIQTETELMRERGLWGPPLGTPLEKWQLDMTEGPCRMRKKMLRNDRFYINYPFKAVKNSRATKYKVAESRDSERYFKRFRSHSLVVDDQLPLTLPSSVQQSTDDLENDDREETVFDEVPVGTPSLLSKFSTRRATLQSQTEDDDIDDMSMGVDNSEIESIPSQDASNQTVLRLLEPNEKISNMYRCARIQGLDTAEGLLLFGKEHFYIIDGFTLLKTKDIVDIDSIPPESHEPIIPKSAKSSTDPKRTCSKFAYEDIREVHKRRYLLQPIAVEVFSVDGRNYLLSFPRKIRNKIVVKFLHLATAITDSANESVSGQKLNAKVEPGTGLISSLMGEKSVTQRWERGEISNFEYLMCLNTLAGRSYNDLMQYPVFPWIVADYDSEKLDLTNPETFRDLSKPMGAQTPNRLKQFHKRYSDWDDPTGDTPPYHYGTHYSSAMIVASYLIRMEPFTQHFLRLQGGHFDLADRMFHSIKDSWLSAAKHNMADVKELIPEFFYLPQFLLNENNFDLGNKQSGVALGDIVLPAWAKNDTREFIRVHREALECDYVSAHLHEWIDLIFGYKQQGPGAIESVNVFHHLFYEGNVDIYAIDDPLERNATIGFINNFGQIPKQLFKKPHPQKKLLLRSGLDTPTMSNISNSSADRLFFHNLDNLKPTMQPIKVERVTSFNRQTRVDTVTNIYDYKTPPVLPVKQLKGAVGHIIANDRPVQAVEQNKVLIPPQYNRYLAWGFADTSLRIGNYESDKASAVFENLDSGEVLCAACPNARVLVTAGTSTVVNVWEFAKSSSTTSTTATRLDPRNRANVLQLKQPLVGHTEPVTCVCASSAYNVCVSGSRDRTCIIWDLSRLLFVKQLRGHSAPVAAVSINDLTGDIATCAGTYLHVWTINGEEIASINTATGRNQQILCVTMSQLMEWDNRNVIMTGNSDGVVRMWSIEFVEVPIEDSCKRERTSGTPNCKTPTGCMTPRATTPSNISTPSTPQQQHNSNPIHIQSKSSSDTITAVEQKLKEFRNLHTLERPVELGSSVESDNSSCIEHYIHHQRHNEGSSLADCTDTMSFDEDSKSVESAVDALAGIDVGSDTGSTTSQGNRSSLGSDFVVVTDSEVKEANKIASPGFGSPQRRRKGLRKGFQWQRQLVFCSKLTMHTAFERKDNKDPAAVSALAISKDHKVVYVGDAKGRVYSWSVTDQPGRAVADHWIKDEGGDACVKCAVKFSFSERRHHCRNCGQLFCSKCSRFETEIMRLRIVKPVRVCQACYQTLKTQQEVITQGVPPGTAPTPAQRAAMLGARLA